MFELYIRGPYTADNETFIFFLAAFAVLFIVVTIYFAVKFKGDPLIWSFPAGAFASAVSAVCVYISDLSIAMSLRITMIALAAVGWIAFIVLFIAMSKLAFERGYISEKRWKDLKSRLEICGALLAFVIVCLVLLLIIK